MPDNPLATLDIIVQADMAKFEKEANANLKRVGKMGAAAFDDSFRPELEKRGAAAGKAYADAVRTGAEKATSSTASSVEQTAQKAKVTVDDLLSQASKENEQYFDNVRAEWRKFASDVHEQTKQEKQDVEQVTQAVGGWKGALLKVLGIYVALRAIRFLSNLARDSIQLALANEQAAGRARELQDAGAGLSDTWRKFKIALGEALIEAGGGTSTMDTLAASVNAVRTVVEDSTPLWRALGNAVAAVLDLFRRLTQFGSEGLLGFFAGIAAWLGIIARGFQVAFQGGSKFFGLFGDNALKRGLQENADNLKKAADEYFAWSDRLWADAMKLGKAALAPAPGVSGQGATSRRLAEEAKKAADARLAIEQELQDRLAALMMDSFHLQYRELDKLEQRYIAAGGRIEGAVKKNFEAIGDAIRQSLELQNLQDAFTSIARGGATQNVVSDLEKLVASTKEWQQQLDAMDPKWKAADDLIGEIQRKIESIRAEAIAEPFRKALDSRMQELRQALAEGIVDKDAFEQQGALAVEYFNAGLLAKIKELEAGGNRELADALRKMLEMPSSTSGRSGNDRARQIRDQARAVREYSDAIIGAAKSLGILDDQTAQTLSSIADLGVAIGRIAGGDLSAIPAAISSAAGLLSGLFGESQADKERKDAIRQNTEAIERLRDAMKASVLSGGNLAKLARALGGGRTAKQGEPTGTQTHPTLNEILGSPISDAGVLNYFASLGLSFKDLKAAADELGITIVDKDGKLIRQGLRQLGDAAWIAAENMLKFADTADGLREKLDFQAQIFDVPDTPEERAKRELAILKEKAPAIFDKYFGGIDASTPQGQRQLEDAQRKLAQDILDGVLDPSALGGLTGEDLKAILLNIDASTDAMAQAATDSAATAGFTVKREITFAQAGTMIGVLTTIAFDTTQLVAWQPRLVDAIRSLGPGGGTGASATAGMMADRSGGVTNHVSVGDVNLAVNGGNFPAVRDRASAREFGGYMGAAAAEAMRQRMEDQRAGQALLGYRRARGLPT